MAIKSAFSSFPPLKNMEQFFSSNLSTGLPRRNSTPTSIVASRRFKHRHLNTETGEVIEISEEELSQGCGEGTHLEDGICVLDETAETTPVSTGTSPSTGFNSWIYSISFTILIAFAIMIILYLISRASRNKNDN